MKKANKNRYERQAELYKNMLVIDPNYLLAIDGLIKTNRVLGNKAAEKTYEQMFAVKSQQMKQSLLGSSRNLIEIDINDPRDHISWMEISFTEGSKELAEIYYEIAFKVLNCDIKDFLISYNACHQQFGAALALEYLLMADHITPNSSEITTTIAIHHLVGLNLSDLALYSVKLIALDPNNDFAQYVQGIGNLYLGKRAEAEKVWSDMPKGNNKEHLAYIMKGIMEGKLLNNLIAEMNVLVEREMRNLSPGLSGV